MRLQVPCRRTIVSPSHIRLPPKNRAVPLARHSCPETTGALSYNTSMISTSVFTSRRQCLSKCDRSWRQWPDCQNIKTPCSGYILNAIPVVVVSCRFIYAAIQGRRLSGRPATAPPLSTVEAVVAVVVVVVVAVAVAVAVAAVSRRLWVLLAVAGEAVEAGELVGWAG